MKRTGSGCKTGKLSRTARTYLKFAMYQKPVKQLAIELEVHPSTICRFRSGQHWNN